MSDCLPTVLFVPSCKRWLCRDGSGILLAAGFAFLLLYIRFWPVCWTTMDESTYLGMAYTLRQGTIFPDAAGLSVGSTFPVGPHMVCKYPLGMPILLAGASVWGWKLCLGINLVVHLLTFWVVIRLLRRQNVPALFAILFLLHPTAVLYSRTVMADPVSGLLIALAFERFLRHRPGQCGLLIGAAILCRTGNALAFPIFLAGFVWPGLRLRFGFLRSGFLRSGFLRSGFLFAAGAAPFLLAAAFYAVGVAHGQMGSHTGVFAPAYFPQMFPGYALGLLLIYPAMLLAPAFYRGSGKAVLRTLCYGTVLLYSFWYYRDRGSSPLETLIVGQRYFLAVLPLFVAAYGAWLWPYLLNISPAKRRVAALVAAAGLFASLFAAAAGISGKHSRYVAALASVRAALLQITQPSDLLLCDAQTAKVMHPGWGARSLLIFNGPVSSAEAAHLNAAIRSLRPPSQARIFAVAWTRSGRADDLAAAQYLSDIKKLYPTRMLSAAERKGLPPEVQAIEIKP